MKIFKYLFSRVSITGMLIGLQLAWFILVLMKLTSYSVWISTGFNVLGVLIVLYIIGKDDNPSYKIGWIVLVMALPFFGSMFYICFGNQGPSKGLRKRLSKSHDDLKKWMHQDETVISEIAAKSERAAGTNRYLLQQNAYPVYKNTTTTYYPVGEKIYEDMLEEIKKAKKFIFVEFFIIEQGIMWNSILKLLIKKAAEGVDVRLIYDDVGSLSLLPSDYPEKMEKCGIKCMAFNPFVPLLSLVMNNRDHRKILAVDGHTAFTGGINLADEYINVKERFGHWKDSGIRVKGDAAWSFTLMFLEMWNAFRNDKTDIKSLKPHFHYAQDFGSDGYVQPFGDMPLDHETVGENLYIEILNQAKRYVYIFTPYLVVGNEMKEALGMAAKRGVDVRIVTPGIPDKKIVYRLTRSNYTVLLKAGIKIYEYTPGFIHAKSYVCDDEFAVIGTINMDYRSFYLHFECGTYLYQTSSVIDLRNDALETIQKSRQVNQEDVKQGVIGSLVNAALKVISPLF